MSTDRTPGSALVFPGQGSQTPGMGQALAASCPAAREAYELASGILGYDLLAACRDEHGELADTTVAQPAVLVHSVATWRALADGRDGPGDIVALAGHSLGEISALVCAGSLDLGRAVTLVQRRAGLMAATPGGGMSVVIGLRPREVERVCGQVSRPGRVVVLANVNSAEQTVISGHRAAVAAASESLAAQGGVVRPLRVGVAPHSPLMEAAAAPYARAVEAAEPGGCALPVVSSTDGIAYRTGAEAAERLVQQLTRCVSWPSAVEGLLGLGVRTIVELGPKTVLRDLIRSAHPGLTVLSCGDPDSVATARLVLASAARRQPGGRVDRRAADDFLTGCLRLAVGTPSPRTSSPAEFDSTVRRPYQELTGMLDAIRSRSQSDGAHVRADVLVEGTRRVMALLDAKGIGGERCRELVDGLAVAAGVKEEVVACLV
ncbi:ACP S-malonyltransferase [Streptomyces sp. NBC_00433]